MFPYSRQQFDTTRPFYARRDFTWDGKVVKLGDEFSSVAVPQDRVQELWSLHYIDHEPVRVVTTEAPPDEADPLSPVPNSDVAQPKQRSSETLPPNPSLRPPKRR